MGNGSPIPLSALGRLLAWNRTYGTVRLHEAFGYKTPDQCCCHCLDTNAAGEAAFVRYFLIPYTSLKGRSPKEYARVVAPLH